MYKFEQNLPRPNHCMPQMSPPLTMSLLVSPVVQGTVIKNQPTPMDSQYTNTVFFEVTQVHYDDIGNIQVGEVIEVKICGLPLGVRRLGFRRSYLLMGERECRTHELIIGENGILESNFDAEGSVCANIINSGVCEQ